MAAEKVQISAHWTFAIIDAVVETFTQMVGIRPQPGRAAFNSTAPVHSDISGIINLVQEESEGVLVVSFSKETIYHILAKIYGREFSEMNSSVQQGVGEFTNIIYGGVKASLNKAGHNFKMALPSVVIGDQHKIINPKAGSTMSVPFTVSGYSFHVTIQIHS